jgi:hypothetical protein
MRRIDVIVEAIIESPFTVVFKASSNEISGVTHWWMHYLGFKLEGIYRTTVRVPSLT